jgi:hypothetical protein
MNQIQNPFDHEENLSTWFNQDKFYSNSKLQQLEQFKTHLKQSPNHQNISIMSFQDSYKNFVNTITKHSITATLIMLLALSTVSVAAAQLFAPEEFKPTTLSGITKKAEPKPVEDKQLSMDKEGEIKTEVEEKSEIDTGKNWTGQITLRPKNYPKLNKTVNDIQNDDIINDVPTKYYCGMYGVTMYGIIEKGNDYFSFNKGIMSIANYNLDSSKNNFKNPTQKEIFDRLSNYITSGQRDSDSSPWYRAFHAECSGYGSTYLYDLDNSKINFKNVDTFKSILVNNTQSPSLNPVVLILAKKGDNFIQLSQQLEAKNINDICNVTDFQKCFLENASKPEFKALAQKAAEELVNTFELDQNYQATPVTPSTPSNTPTKKILSYTNPYFPDFKLVYPEDWKFETKTENVGTFYENYKNLLIRTVTISKNNKNIQITLQPKSLGDSNCGGAGAEPKLLQTFSNKLNKLNTLIGGDTLEYNFEVQSNGICPTKSYFNTSIDSNFDKDYVKSFPNDKIVQYSILIRVFNRNDGSYILTNDSTIGEIDDILSQSTLPKIIN